METEQLIRNRSHRWKVLTTAATAIGVGDSFTSGWLNGHFINGLILALFAGLGVLLQFMLCGDRFYPGPEVRRVLSKRRAQVLLFGMMFPEHIRLDEVHKFFLRPQQMLRVFAACTLFFGAANLVLAKGSPLGALTPSSALYILLAYTVAFVPALLWTPVLIAAWTLVWALGSAHGTSSMVFLGACLMAASQLLFFAWLQNRLTEEARFLDVLSKEVLENLRQRSHSQWLTRALQLALLSFLFFWLLPHRHIPKVIATRTNPLPAARTLPPQSRGQGSSRARKKSAEGLGSGATQQSAASSPGAVTQLSTEPDDAIRKADKDQLRDGVARKGAANLGGSRSTDAGSGGDVGKYKLAGAGGGANAAASTGGNAAAGGGTNAAAAGATAGADVAAGAGADATAGARADATAGAGADATAGGGGNAAASGGGNAAAGGDAKSATFSAATTARGGAAATGVSADTSAGVSASVTEADARAGASPSAGTNPSAGANGGAGAIPSTGRDTGARANAGADQVAGTSAARGALTSHGSKTDAGSAIGTSERAESSTGAAVRNGPNAGAGAGFSAAADSETNIRASDHTAANAAAGNGAESRAREGRSSHKATGADDVANLPPATHGMAHARAGEVAKADAAGESSSGTAGSGAGTAGSGAGTAGSSSGTAGSSSGTAGSGAAEATSHARSSSRANGMGHGSRAVALSSKGKQSQANSIQLADDPKSGSTSGSGGPTEEAPPGIASAPLTSKVTATAGLRAKAQPAVPASSPPPLPRENPKPPRKPGVTHLRYFFAGAILVFLVAALVAMKRKKTTADMVEGEADDEGDLPQSPRLKSAMQRFQQEMGRILRGEVIGSAATAEAVIELYHLLLSHFERCGQTREANQTPDEFATHISARMAQGRADLTSVTGLFCAVLYGRQTPSAASFENFVAQIARLGKVAPRVPALPGGSRECG